MKKIILIALVAFSLNATAQKSPLTPRWGSGFGNDNTGRALTWDYNVIVDAAGSDSVSIAPNNYENIYKVALIDSVTIKNIPTFRLRGSDTAFRSYVGDKMTIIATSASSGKKLKFSNANIVSVGTATTSTNNRAVVSFIFDGLKWVETNRTVQ